MTELLKAEEVARRLGVTKPYVYRLGRDGLLPRVALPGDVVRFRAEDVETFIAAHHEQAPRQRPRATRTSQPAAIPSRF